MNMKRLSDTSRALVLPADISIPEAYILGCKDSLEEFIEDLKEILKMDSYWRPIHDKTLEKQKKWEKEFERL